MSELREKAIAKIAREIAKEIRGGMTLGLGSGSTVASILHELASFLRIERIKVGSVPTSLQIQGVAEREGLSISAYRGTVDLVIDGADQVDDDLNLIKGGGGALLKEKILMSSASKIIIVADKEKFSPRLGMRGVRVPVEVTPFAKEAVKRRLTQLGGDPLVRMLPKGYPYFTENGNIILDTGFSPIDDPRKLEVTIDSVPGVVESGIFTIKPLTVYKILADGKSLRLTA